MKTLAISITLAVILLAGVLAVTTLYRQVASSSVEADTVLLNVLVAAAQQNRESTLRVDPRPLRAGANIGHVAVETMAEVPNADIEARSRILARLGVPETDALRDSRCVGPFVGILDPSLLHSCPKSGPVYHSAIFSLPRPGGAANPSGGIDRYTEDPEKDLMTVRSIERFMTADGAPVTIIDYVVERSGHGWAVIEVRTIGFAD